MAKTEKQATRDKNGRVKKGAVLNPRGRAKGTQNKITVELKTMVETALQVAGSQLKDASAKQAEADSNHEDKLKNLDDGVAYLVAQAHENPKVFMTLVKQIIPAKIDLNVQMMNEEMIGVLEQRRRQVRDMRDVTPQQIEGKAH